MSLPTNETDDPWNPNVQRAPYPARDICAVNALTLALRHLGPALGVADGSGNVALGRRAQDIEYIRMTLDLYGNIPCDLPRQE